MKEEEERITVVHVAKAKDDPRNDISLTSFNRIDYSLAFGFLLFVLINPRDEITTKVVVWSCNKTGTWGISYVLGKYNRNLRNIFLNNGALSKNEMTRR